MVKIMKKEITKDEENYENWKDNYSMYMSYYLSPESVADGEKPESLENLQKEIKQTFGIKNENIRKASSWVLSEHLLNKMLSYNPKDREKIIMKCMDIAYKKNKDYGSANILDFGISGLLVRINDKIARLVNLQKVKTRSVQDETIEDTVEDIINYSVYLQMLSEDVWF